jgi:hypothetical protein
VPARHLHTAGVIGFDGLHNVVRHDGTGFDDFEVIAEGLAASAPSYAPGTKHCYHALLPRADDRLADRRDRPSRRWALARPVLRR